MYVLQKYIVIYGDQLLFCLIKVFGSMLFVGDFSIYTWLYPLKRKSDFYRICFNFQAMDEKQFQRQIQIFQ